MALASSDWTIAEVGFPHNRSVMSNGDRRSFYTMTLASTGLYASGGIPIPRNPKTWGFKSVFKRLNIIDSAQGSGVVWKYAATGYVMRAYENPASASDTGTAQAALTEMATTASAGTGGTQILYVEATGY